MDAFAACLQKISHPVVYNGDITDTTIFSQLETRFPDVEQWMVGRGLIANPFLGEMIQSGEASMPTAAARFADFHADLLKGYLDRFSGPGHVLDRMKGLWHYFVHGVDDGQRFLKQIRKTQSLERYRERVNQMLAHGYRLP